MSSAKRPTRQQKAIEEKQSKQPSAFYVRVAQAVVARGISGNELERRAELGRGYFSRLKSQGFRVEPEKIGAIGAALKVRCEWLVTGKGPMFEEDVEESGIRATLEQTLASHPGRWEERHIKAARILHEGSSPPGGWAWELDRIKGSTR